MTAIKTTYSCSADSMNSKSVKSEQATLFFLRRGDGTGNGMILIRSPSRGPRRRRRAPGPLPPPSPPPPPPTRNSGVSPRYSSTSPSPRPSPPACPGGGGGFRLEHYRLDLSTCDSRTNCQGGLFSKSPQRLFKWKSRTDTTGGISCKNLASGAFTSWFCASNHSKQVPGVLFEEQCLVYPTGV